LTIGTGYEGFNGLDTEIQVTPEGGKTVQVSVDTNGVVTGVSSAPGDGTTRVQMRFAVVDAITFEAVNSEGSLLTSNGGFVRVPEGAGPSNSPTRSFTNFPLKAVHIGAGYTGLDVKLWVTPRPDKTVVVDVNTAGQTTGVSEESTPGTTKVRVRFAVAGNITFEAANRSGGLLNDIAGDAGKKGYVEYPLGSTPGKPTLTLSNIPLQALTIGTGYEGFNGLDTEIQVTPEGGKTVQVSVDTNGVVTGVSSVAGDGTTRVQVRLAVVDAITFEVVEAEGKPLPDAFVRVPEGSGVFGYPALTLTNFPLKAVHIGAGYTGLDVKLWVTPRPGETLVVDVNASGQTTGMSYQPTPGTTKVMVRFQLNRPPVAVADAYSVNEDNLLTVAAKGVLSNDSDADNDALTAALVAGEGPASGTLTLNGDGSFTYAPNANFNGTDSFKYKAKDIHNAVSDPVAVTITVNAVNDAPTLAAIPDPAAILEDAGAQTISLTGVGTGAANETQVLTVTATSSNPALIPNPTVTYTSPNATGGLSYTPAANASGEATITVTVKDDGGTANGGADTTSRTFKVTVTPVNDAPVLNVPSGNAADGSFTVNEGATLSFNVTATDPDQGDVLTLTASGLPAGATFSGGTFSWTPNFTQAGTYTVTFQVEDNGSPKLSATKTATITVNNVNRPPVLTVPGPQTVFANVPLTFTVTSSDPDVGDVVTFSATGLPAGATFNTSTGAFSWTPNFTQFGAYTVTFTATDNGAPPLSSPPATVSITVKNALMFIGVHSGAPTIQKGLRNEDIVKFSRDDQGDVMPSTVEKFFDGSQFFKGDEQLDAAAALDWDGDGNLDLIFSVRSKAKLKVGGMDIRPGDLILYDPDRPANKFEKFLEGSSVFADRKPGRDRDDDDDDDDDDDRGRNDSGSKVNIDGVAVRKAADNTWKVFLTTTRDAQIGTLQFDKNDVVQVDYNPATRAVSSPVKVLDASALFRGKEANLDALDVVDDDGNGTFESVVFSTSTKERLKDGREIRASVVYLHNRETNTTEENFDPVADGLSRTQVNISAVSTIGPLKPWGAGPKPAAASKKGKKGQALLAKVSGEEEAGPAAPEALPEAFGLEQNAPNPFNPTTTIRYSLPEGADVRLVIYNILGQRVKTLVNGAQGPGRYTVVWDGRDDAGRPAATGMYVYRLQAGAFAQARKMLFAK
jgi:VCBS repeat-containing protein